MKISKFRAQRPSEHNFKRTQSDSESQKNPIISPLAAAHMNFSLNFHTTAKRRFSFLPTENTFLLNTEKKKRASRWK